MKKADTNLVLNVKQLSYQSNVQAVCLYYIQCNGEGMYSFYPGLLMGLRLQIAILFEMWYERVS